MVKVGKGSGTGPSGPDYTHTPRPSVYGKAPVPQAIELNLRDR